MPGFQRDTTGATDQNVVYADNYDFSGSSAPRPKVSATGQLPIGTGASPAIAVGNITSPLGTLTIGYSNPNITIDLKGGGVAIDQIQVQTGLTPITPDGNGQIILSGGTVVAGTNPIRTDGTAAHTIVIETQISQALAATDATKIGLANFDSARFTCDANGFVSVNGSGIGETITGDSGGALSPTAGNWNILGRSGSKTSGSGSTLTVKSPPYADQGGSTTVTLNSGSFATAAITLTLPASAGLADGDLCTFTCTSASTLVIQAVGSQKIRIGSLLSSAAGSASSTSAGDSVDLRFRASDGFWYATSVIGTWIIS